MATAAKIAASATKVATSAAKAASTTSASSTAAAAPTAPTTTPPRKFFADFRCCGIFFVENIERRQTDVGNFLLLESDFVTRCGVTRRYIFPRPTGSCGRSVRQRQGHPGDPQKLHGP